MAVGAGSGALVLAGYRGRLVRSRCGGGIGSGVVTGGNWCGLAVMGWGGACFGVLALGIPLRGQLVTNRRQKVPFSAVLCWLGLFFYHIMVIIYTIC